MKKAEKDEVLKILHECITHPEIDEDDEALVDYRQAKLMIMGIQEEPSFEIKHMEEKKEKGGCRHACIHKKEDGTDIAGEEGYRAERRKHVCSECMELIKEMRAKQKGDAE